MEANFTASNSKPSEQHRSTENLSRGLRFEQFATAHCERLGYRVLARNYRIGRLEADIVARDGDCLVLVEVRGRVGRQFRPSVVISPAKIRRLQSLASMLLRDAGWCSCVRIELFEVLEHRGELFIEVFSVK